MFKQVAKATLFISLLVGLFIALWQNQELLKAQKWNYAFAYMKARAVRSLDPFLDSVAIGSRNNRIIYVDEGRYIKKVPAQTILRSYRYKDALHNVMDALSHILILTGGYALTFLGLIFISWSSFGRSVKADQKIKGGEVLTAKEVYRKLKKIKKLGKFKVGEMPLVKDSETRHILVTGSTGSGKTNLLHTLLSQVEEHQHPAIVIDQTGEMISKYYNPDRGDIIFNPLDNRSKCWDFWSDCSNKEEQMRFSKILMGFNIKTSGSNADPFWVQSAEVIFNSCVEVLQKEGKYSFAELDKLLRCSDLKILQHRLAGTEAARYLQNDGKTTAMSILSVLATNTRPMSYLTLNEYAEKFSLKQYFRDMKQGSQAWLFLATKPSSRELTQPLIACLTELSLSMLVDAGINSRRRLWYVMDELSALGKLPALSYIMSEGRKYGACVLSALQSLNQLYSHYGQHEGSTIFGQFGTSFFFRNNEESAIRMISNLCGSKTLYKQQKNTSFGANEYRDGISYNEQEKQQKLVDGSDLSNLGIGECYALLPEPEVRLSKLQLDECNIEEKTDGFMSLSNADIPIEQLVSEDSKQTCETIEAKDRLGLDNHKTGTKGAEEIEINIDQIMK